MSQSLKISALGKLTIERDGLLVRALPRKAKALLVYLAITQQPQSRERLAALLWAGYPQERATTSLRVLLTTLRRAMGPYLTIRRQSVAFNQAGSYWFDVAELEQGLAAVREGRPGVSKADSAPLAQALALYQGEFLAGFHVPHSLGFEEWLLMERERLQRKVVTALDRLVEGYLAQGDYPAGIEQAKRLLHLDPFREAAHRQLMQLLALSGDRAGTLAQYETCRRILVEELSLEPTPETTAFYEQIRSGERQDKPPTRTAAASPHSSPPALEQPQVAHTLPPQPTPLVGREAELAELGCLLADPDRRLVTVVGLGGMGKSRLAIEAATIQSNAFADGVKFVPLTAVDAAEANETINPVVGSLADRLNFAFRGDQVPERQLLDHLHYKEMLIVFDDFERLLKGAGFVSELLKNAPRLKILVTSRERLNLQEEWLFYLQGLRTPTDGIIPPDVEDYGAVQLFWQRARQVQADFDFVAQKAAVVRICQLVEGMPLAIELAAAWVRLLPCQAIAREIEQNIDFLATNLRNVPARHRSLRAVFDRSWQLLPAAERVVMKKLSVFRGGFQREAAQRVAGASLFQLSTLADKSLLHVSPAGRYEIHGRLQQYAAEKLQQSPADYEGARDRHSQIFLNFLHQGEGDLKSERFKRAIAAITADIDNIRAAWRWAVRRNKEAAIQKALESLWLYYEAQGWFLEGKEIFSHAAARVRPHSRPPEAARLTYADASAVADTSFIFGRVLTCQAWFQARLGQFEPAENLFKESLSLLQQAGRKARRDRAFCLTLWGVLMNWQGAYAAANRFFQSSLPLFNELGDSWGSGFALLYLGRAAFALGEHAEAERLLCQSMTTLNIIGERRLMVHAKATIGRVAQVRGQFEQAETIHSECLEICTELGNREGVAYTLNDLAECARHRGQHGQAEAYYRQSMATAQEINLPLLRAQALWGLGSLAEGFDDFVTANHYFQECIAILEELGAPFQMAFALAGLGWAALGLGEFRATAHYFHEALKLATRSQRMSLALDALAGLAHLRARTGDSAEAWELLNLILDHPALTQGTKNRIAKLRAELVAELPPEDLPMARERDGAREIAAVVGQIMGADD